jgi:DNA-binding FrmR family transcriptional regulator
MTELDILKYVVDTGTKFGLSAASLMYLICMVVFPIYGFKYLTKRDLEEKIEREKNEKEREGLQQKVIGLIETNKNYIFDVVEKFNRDGEAKRKVYADMLQIQLETASKMMDDDAYCIDVMHQMQAIESGLRGTGNLLLENHLKGCVADAITKGKAEESIAEIMQVFKKAR